MNNEALENNKRIIRRLLEEGIAKQDTSILDELIAASEVREEWERKLAAFADLELRAEHMIAEGDEVWTRGVFTGTLVGDYAGYPATGRFVELPYMDWWKVRDGRVVDNWGVWNPGALREGESIPSRAN
jgi:predicted ester cyclase